MQLKNRLNSSSMNPNSSQSPAQKEMNTSNDEQNQDLVSVVVPSYNHSQYITQCIDSIINQTYKNIQLIVVDDGSSDGSQDILINLKKKYHFELYLQNNKGLSKTLNNTLTNKVKGKYFSICASDDYFHPDKIRKMRNYLNENKDTPMCFSKTIFVDEKGSPKLSETNYANRNLKGGRIFRELLIQQFHFLPGLITTSIFQEVGYYDENIWTEDFNFNLKVAHRYKIGFLNEQLSYYRYPNNFSKKLSNTKIPNEHRKCIDLYKNNQHYKEALREWHFRNFLWFSSYKNHKKLAFKSMICSIMYFYRPSFCKSLVLLIVKWS